MSAQLFICDPRRRLRLEHIITARDSVQLRLRELGPTHVQHLLSLLEEAEQFARGQILIPSQDDIFCPQKITREDEAYMGELRQQVFALFKEINGREETTLEQLLVLMSVEADVQVCFASQSDIVAMNWEQRMYEEIAAKQQSR